MQLGFGLVTLGKPSWFVDKFVKYIVLYCDFCLKIYMVWMKFSG